MASLALKGVCKSYGPVPVVCDLDLSIADGEFAVLVGPSGCGKTTTLRMIAGLEHADRGEIRFDDVPAGRLPPRKRDVGVVFQHYSLYRHLSVRDNLAFGLKAHGADRATIGQKVAEVAGILKISHLLDRRPSQLSGGERQRVAMGRALVRRPRIYLFDEPFSSLDAALRLELRTEIKRIHQRFKTTFVYVTHDQAEAMSLADTLVVMDRGRIMQVGSPMEVYRRPRSVFVATFMGSPPMNLLEGSLSNRDSRFFFRSAIGEIPLASGLLPGLNHKENGRYYMGIRPEDILLTRTSEGQVSLEGQIHIVERLGMETLAVAGVGDEELRIHTSGKNGLNPSEKVALFIDPDSTHLFDADTGEAVTKFL